MTETSGEAAPTLPTESVPRRPSGASAVVVLWVLFGLANVYFGITELNADAGAFPLLSTNPSGLNSTQVAALNWLQFGLPADAAIFALLFVIGVLQVACAFGLWNAHRWSYRGAMVTVLLVPASWILQAALYYSAPPILGLASPTLASGAVGSVFWVVIYFRYLRQPNVRAYLHLEEKLAPAPSAPVNTA